MFRFNYYGKINVDSIIEKLQHVDWDAFEFRQKTYIVHKDTKTVPLMMNKDKKLMDALPKQLIWDDFAIFEEELNKIKLILPRCEIVNAILVILPAGKNILPHRDKDLFFDLYSRIHIPIITNPKCLFTVDGETIHMKAGELWEINNKKIHSVENNGEEDRIHLIIDCDFESI
jgi:hypothetical protein